MEALHPEIESQKEELFMEWVRYCDWKSIQEQKELSKEYTRVVERDDE